RLRDPGARRDEERVEKALDEVEVVGRAHSSEEGGCREGGVLQEARLHDVGLRDAELLVGGLQRGVVEERDLDGGLRGQIACEEGLDGFALRFPGNLVLLPLEALRDASLRRERLHLREAVPAYDVSAAAERDDEQDERARPDGSRSESAGFGPSRSEG